MASEALPDPDDDGAETFGVRVVAITAEEAQGRVDKVLATRLPEMSRGRIQALMSEGRISRDGTVLGDASAKAQPGDYRLEIPAPTPAEPAPEAIPLTVLFEDQYL
ncbi:MAG: S4 domain-containing protein, partial [Phenylobacterium sp.]